MYSRCPNRLVAVFINHAALKTDMRQTLNPWLEDVKRKNSNETLSHQDCQQWKFKNFQTPGDCFNASFHHAITVKNDLIL